MFFKNDRDYQILTEYIHPPKAPVNVQEYYEYVKPSVEEMDSLLEYDMDEEDIAWLELMNEKRTSEKLCSVSLDSFEELMDRFEKDCFLQCQSKSFKPIPQKLVNQLVCCICFEATSNETNMMLICDMCNLSVHQQCYGIIEQPDNIWLCERCIYSPSHPVECCLCPSRFGAFKRVGINTCASSGFSTLGNGFGTSLISGNDVKWVHVNCTYWMPEMKFGDWRTKEPILGLDKIAPARWKLGCFICQQRGCGACVQCSDPNCYTSFHITCAQAAALTMNIEINEKSSSPTKIVFLCDEHSPPNKTILNHLQSENMHENLHDAEKDKTAEDNKSRRLKAARRLIFDWKTTIQPIFNPLVTKNTVNKILKKALELKIDKSEEFVTRLHSYWTLKRQARNGCPIISSRKFIKNIKIKQDICEDDGGSIFTMYLQFCQRLRQDLEKVRLLIELIRKREKLKMEQTNLRESEMHLLLDPTWFHMFVTYQQIDMLYQSLSDDLKTKLEMTSMSNKKIVSFKEIKNILDKRNYSEASIFVSDFHRFLDSLPNNFLDFQQKAEKILLSLTEKNQIEKKNLKHDIKARSPMMEKLVKAKPLSPKNMLDDQDDDLTDDNTDAADIINSPILLKSKRTKTSEQRQKKRGRPKKEELNIINKRRRSSKIISDSSETDFVNKEGFFINLVRSSSDESNATATVSQMLSQSTFKQFSDLLMPFNSEPSSKLETKSINEVEISSSAKPDLYKKERKISKVHDSSSLLEVNTKKLENPSDRSKFTEHDKNIGYKFAQKNDQCFSDNFQTSKQDIEINTRDNKTDNPEGILKSKFKNKPFSKSTELIIDPKFNLKSNLYKSDEINLSESKNKTFKKNTLKLDDLLKPSEIGKLLTPTEIGKFEIEQNVNEFLNISKVDLKINHKSSDTFDNCKLGTKTIEKRSIEKLDETAKADIKSKSSSKIDQSNIYTKPDAKFMQEDLSKVKAKLSPKHLENPPEELLVHSKPNLKTTLAKLEEINSKKNPEANMKPCFFPIDGFTKSNISNLEYLTKDSADPYSKKKYFKAMFEKIDHHPSSYLKKELNKDAKSIKKDSGKQVNDKEQLSKTLVNQQQSGEQQSVKESGKEQLIKEQHSRELSRRQQLARDFTIKEVPSNEKIDKEKMSKEQFDIRKEKNDKELANNDIYTNSYIPVMEISEGIKDSIPSLDNDKNLESVTKSKDSIHKKKNKWLFEERKDDSDDFESTQDLQFKDHLILGKDSNLSGQTLKMTDMPLELKNYDIDAKKQFKNISSSDVGQSLEIRKDPVPSLLPSRGNILVFKEDKMKKVLDKLKDYQNIGLKTGTTSLNKREEMCSSETEYEHNIPAEKKFKSHLESHSICDEKQKDEFKETHKYLSKNECNDDGLCVKAKDSKKCFLNMENKNKPSKHPHLSHSSEENINVSINEDNFYNKSRQEPAIDSNFMDIHSGKSFETLKMDKLNNYKDHNIDFDQSKINNDMKTLKNDEQNISISKIVNISNKKEISSKLKSPNEDDSVPLESTCNLVDTKANMQFIDKNINKTIKTSEVNTNPALDPIVLASFAKIKDNSPVSNIDKSINDVTSANSSNDNAENNKIRNRLDDNVDNTRGNAFGNDTNFRNTNVNKSISNSATVNTIDHAESKEVKMTVDDEENMLIETD